LLFSMHQFTHHAMSFLVGEFGTRGSVEGQQPLIFSCEAFEEILQAAVKEYVNVGLLLLQLMIVPELHSNW